MQTIIRQNHPSDLSRLSMENADLIVQATRRINSMLIPMPDKVIESVCDYFHVPRSEMFARNNTFTVARPRFLTLHLLHDLCQMNYSELARMFGMDHKSVMYGIRMTVRRKKSDKVFAMQVAEIEKILIGT